MRSYFKIEHSTKGGRLAAIYLYIYPVGRGFESAKSSRAVMVMFQNSRRPSLTFIRGVCVCVYVFSGGIEFNRYFNTTIVQADSIGDRVP